MLKEILERLSRNYSFKRRLPSRFNYTPLYVSPDSQLKYLKLGENAFDADLLKIVDWYIDEDSIVWDIGANVGVFTFASASVAKKGYILAIEADIWLAGLLRKSLLLKENCELNIEILPCAIANQDGIAKFLIAQRGRASNSLEITGSRSQAGGIREKITVPTLKLDTLLDFFSPPNFVKIDVEGAEAIVLDGASRLLTEIRPTIYIEVGNKANKEVSSILKQKDYLLFDGSKPIKEQKNIEYCTYNTLAIPKNRVST